MELLVLENFYWIMRGCLLVGVDRLCGIKLLWFEIDFWPAVTYRKSSFRLLCIAHQFQAMKNCGLDCSNIRRMLIDDTHRLVVLEGKTNDPPHCSHQVSNEHNRR